MQLLFQIHSLEIIFRWNTASIPEKGKKLFYKKVILRFLDDIKI